jgi:hypothetical protein
MKIRRHYGFAALDPMSDYPTFRSGVNLAFMPCDFLLSEPVGFQLKLFLEDGSRRWQRFSTDSTTDASRELVSKVIAPDVKAISTFRCTDRTRLPKDGVVQVVEYTCHAASYAVIQELLATAASQHSVLKEWVIEHAGLLASSGGVVFPMLVEYELRLLDERSDTLRGVSFIDFLALARAAPLTSQS